jgi:hypothetical protein
MSTSRTLCAPGSTGGILPLAGDRAVHLRLAGDRAVHLHGALRDALRAGLAEYSGKDGVRAPRPRGS